MSKYGFNEKELRKTIVTKIDKDGFHEQTVTYGKDSGGSGESGDWSSANVTFYTNESNTQYRVTIPIAFPSESSCILRKVRISLTEDEVADNPNNGQTFILPLYKGKYILSVVDNVDDIGNSPFVITGNAEVISNGDEILITGDCTITFSGSSNDTIPK